MSSEPFNAHTTAKVRPIASRIQRTFLTSVEPAVELRESHGLKVADLDEDLSFRRLLEGNHGQRTKRDESCVVREEPPKSNP